MLTGEGHLNDVFSDGSVVAPYFDSMLGSSLFAIRVGEGGGLALACSYFMLTGEGHLNDVFSDGSVVAPYFESMVGSSFFAIRVGEDGVTGDPDFLMLWICSYITLNGEGHLNGVFSDGSVVAPYFRSSTSGLFGLLPGLIYCIFIGDGHLNELSLDALAAAQYVYIMLAFGAIATF
jgi:hypothetical protein